MPHLVILDLKLPRISGFEVLARLRSEPGGKDVPVVVHSSSWEARDIDRAYRLGAARAAALEPL
ncbi:MAG: response regulator [Pseudomonadota bacterium]|nr:response regulator [Pseudomonadota bacterium]